MTFRAYAVKRAGAKLEPFEYEPEPLKNDEVEIAITHCGICHSDVHLADGDWGDWFPLVPGHEIVGTVTVGRAFARGERVGVGWQRDSCGECEYCRAGEEVFCADNQATCQGHFGGFADRIRVNERFVFPIPDSLTSERAAPLLCGGITVYTPLKQYAGPGSRVGVIGIGGLGHLALQFARALGCEVNAFSRVAEKRADALAFGAHEFVTGEPAKRSLDLILNTAPASPNMGAFLAALRPRGVFCQLGAAPDPLSISAGPLIGANRAVAGSAIGNPNTIHEMLEHAAANGIGARVEVRPMRLANEALEITRQSRSRFRMVLVN
jgi:uncharacterized zinc-type alcohol dehydrogenase-like protein